MILKLYFPEALGYNDFLIQLKNEKYETIMFQKTNDTHTIFLYCNDIVTFGNSSQIYEYFYYLNDFIIKNIGVYQDKNVEYNISWKSRKGIFIFYAIITQIPCYIPARGKGSESLLYTLAAIDILTKQQKEPKIKDVKFNDPATIVFWEDGTKTVVKAQDGEKFDKEKGLAMAIIKKSQGNNSKYYEIFKKYIKD